MTNLQELIEAAQKELRYEGFCRNSGTVGLEAFLESKVREAYKAGAEAMRDEIGQIYSGGLENELTPESGFDVAAQRVYEQAEAFLLSLKDV